MGKKKILFVYTSMIIGGATTSLLSLLHSIDYKHYDVDLLLYEHNGPRQGEIPPQVRILSQAMIHQSSNIKNLIKKGTSPVYMRALLYATILQKWHHNKLLYPQIMSKQGARYSRKLDEKYDVAVSFLEFWPFHYTANYVQAKRKIAWIHVDYLEAGLLPWVDAPTFAMFQHIVLVSQQGVDNFQHLFPQYAHKAIYIPNLLSQTMIRKAALMGSCDKPLPTTGIRLVSVCRISFAHKGLDRGVKAFSLLQKENQLNDLQWIIIGDGDDYPLLKNMIQAEGLEQHIHLLGMQTNPLPCVAQLDAFFLPSRFEGKPMAVTEAQMLGLPALVTHYASAREQIREGKDGFILDNDVQGIVNGLRRLVLEPNLLPAMQQYTKQQDYSNLQDIDKVYALFDA